MIDYAGMVDIKDCLQRYIRSRDNQGLTSSFMEMKQRMIQNMGRAKMDKGKREYVIGMNGNSPSKEKEF